MQVDDLDPGLRGCVIIPDVVIPDGRLAGRSGIQLLKIINMFFGLHPASPDTLEVSPGRKASLATPGFRPPEPAGCPGVAEGEAGPINGTPDVSPGGLHKIFVRPDPYRQLQPNLS